VQIVRIANIAFVLAHDQLMGMGAVQVGLEQAAPDDGGSIVVAQCDLWKGFRRPLRIGPIEGAVCAVHLALVPKPELLYRLLHDLQLRHVFAVAARCQAVLMVAKGLARRHCSRRSGYVVLMIHVHVAETGGICNANASGI